ncbi:MAG: hypothetical protein WBB82_01545 [Limnothrix sp.]
MLPTLFWFVALILGANFIFTEGLTLIPDAIISGLSRRLGWLVIGAIALFFVWCFAED